MSCCPSPLPVRSLWPSTRALDESNRSTSSISPISRLTNNTACFSSQITCSQMFSASAVLPMLGRAARMMSWVALESAGDLVEVVIAGRDPGDRVPVLGPGGDPVHRLDDHFLDLDRLARRLVLGDGEDPLLGGLEQFVGREVVRVAVPEDLVGALDQLPAGRPAA